MKKLYVTFLAFILFLNAKAQFDITSAYNPSAGSYSAQVLESTASEGNGGTGQTWDFSSYTSSSSITGTYQSPSGTKYESNFPGANLVAISNNQQYVYYYLDANKFTVLGSAIYTSGYDDILTYSSALNYYTYPFNYGTTQIYSGSGETDLKSGSSTLTATGRKINDTASIDGSGTLIVPGGTSYNAVRMKFIQNIVDSTDDGYGDWTYLYTRMVTYNFLAEGINNPVIAIDYSTITTVPAFGSPSTSSSKTVLYTPASATGVANKIIDQNKVMVFPNPISDKININFNLIESSNVKITLESIDGKSIHEFLNADMPSGDQNMSFYLPEKMEKGIYLIRINSGDNSVVKKVVIR